MAKYDKDHMRVIEFAIKQAEDAMNKLNHALKWTSGTTMNPDLIEMHEEVSFITEHLSRGIFSEDVRSFS